MPHFMQEADDRSRIRILLLNSERGYRNQNEDRSRYNTWRVSFFVVNGELLRFVTLEPEQLITVNLAY